MTLFMVRKDKTVKNVSFSCVILAADQLTAEELLQWTLIYIRSGYMFYYGGASETCCDGLIYPFIGSGTAILGFSGSSTNPMDFT